MGRLHTLELENFKSYKGNQIVGPFKQFTAIIGPNGSGKSNLMDAMCFVLGEKASNLRVKKLHDLIHGAPVGKAVANRCHVTMNYEDDDGNMRALHEYRVDGKTVTPQQYGHALEEINVFMKAKNFLVYQGQVEQVAMKNPRELTQMFEEISRSCEFQADYDRLKTELAKAEEEAAFNLNKRRGIALEKREAKLEKDEAEKYQMLKEELEAKQRQVYLLQLFYAEKMADETTSDWKPECDAAVTAKQHEHKKVLKEVHKLENNTSGKEKEVMTQKPRYVAAKQGVVHVKAKLEMANKAHSNAQRAAEAHETNVVTLKNQLRKKQECEAKLATESQELAMQLSDAQVNEYYGLKGEATKRCGVIDMELNKLLQEQETEKNNLQFEQRRLTHANDRVKNKEQEIERISRQGEQLSENIVSQNNLIQDEKKNLQNLEVQVRESKERLEKVTSELNNVSRQLSEAHGDTAESERNRKRNETIENLKRIFPDRVYGRLVDLCQPSHRRFQIAITKVLAKNMMSIVCDTDETARESIIYLKEQRLAPETFLPLSILDVHPVKEKLRELTEPRGVKLVFDVIQCNNPIARKALQFACGNALVCETPDDAKYLAYGSASDRYKAVALDGTLFERSGIISGGGQELRQRAKKWDENAIRKLKENRVKLQDELQQLHRTRKKELDVEMKRNQLIHLENRLKNTRNEHTKITSQTLKKLEQDLETLNSELSLIQPRIDEIEQRMAERIVQIEKLQRKRNIITDEVFHEFCQRINIKDIRQYEQREMRFHEEMQDQLKKFDNELDRLRNELDYLKSEDKRLKEKQEAEKVKRLTKEIEGLKKKEEEEHKTLKKLESELEQMKMAIVSKKALVEDSDAEISVLKKTAQQAAREVAAAEKTAAALEQIISRRRHQRHSLLHQCKMNGIKLPLLRGSLADIEIDDAIPSSTASASVSDSQQLSHEQMDREAQIQVDYRTFPVNLREFDNDEEVKKALDKLNKEVSDSQAKISRISAPNMKAKESKEKEAETTEECELARKKHGKFKLSRNESAQAFLGEENMEEPYLEGIAYNCVAPGKRFRPMDNLSGGEKTVAALALLFAIHARSPSPFFILDEVDAALDNTNIGKVANFICERAHVDMQLIVISLKEEFYNKADAIIGIYPHPSSYTVSGMLTLDLTPYKQPQSDSFIE
ncbi:Structural maintenance of chromosomes protein 1A [Dirofilaria immitis]|nr:Structural maintenance of chromosomes protein 1A [Dirofilaria immitis]